MATLYKIKLSSAKEKIELPAQSGNKVVDEAVRIRDIELEILEVCVGLASTREKDIKKYSMLRDLYEQVRDISKTATEVTDLTKEDIDLIKSGFSLTAEMQMGRPFKWLKCKKLIDQLLEPEEKNDNSKKE